MKYPMILALLAAGTATAAFYPAAAQAQEDCAVQVKKKKGGLGIQLGRGLKSSIEGALRGDGDLGSDLKGTAEQAADRSERDAASTAGCKQAPREERGSDASVSDGAAADGASETATQRARREMAASDAKYPSRMPIPDEWKTAKAAYDEFGKVKCFGCEGGYAYAGWPDWPRDEYSGKYGVARRACRVCRSATSIAGHPMALPER